MSTNTVSQRQLGSSSKGAKWAYVEQEMVSRSTVSGSLKCRTLLTSLAEWLEKTGEELNAHSQCLSSLAEPIAASRAWLNLALEEHHRCPKVMQLFPPFQFCLNPSQSSLNATLD